MAEDATLGSREKYSPAAILFYHHHHHHNHPLSWEYRRIDTVVNTSPTPEEGAHSLNWPNRLLIIIVVMIVIIIR